MKSRWGSIANSACFIFILCFKGGGDAIAIDGRGDYASGVAGTFATGVEVAEVDVLEGGGVACEANGRGCAGLYGYDDGLVGEKSVRGASEGDERLL